MKKALFWDFDGTLTHTGPLWSHAVHEAAERECGATLPFEAVRAEMRIGFSWHTPGDDHTALIGGRMVGSNGPPFFGNLPAAGLGGRASAPGVSSSARPDPRSGPVYAL